jgi:hypothetical protein
MDALEKLCDPSALADAFDPEVLKDGRLLAASGRSFDCEIG